MATEILQMNASSEHFGFWAGWDLPSIKSVDELQEKIAKKSLKSLNSLNSVQSIEDVFAEICQIIDLDNAMEDDDELLLVDDHETTNQELDSILCSLHTHDGSIEMQKLLQNGMIHINDVISRLVYLSQCSALDLSSLACAMYGNFCIQKLFEFGDIEWSSQLFMAMVPGNVWKICSSSYGCWVMQTMINRVNHECIEYLLTELANDTVPVMDKISHANCNHVLQQIIQSRLPFEQIEFISDSIFWDSESISYACKTQFGCRVAQSLIKNYASHIDFSKCFDPSENGNCIAVNMADQKYANFVISCILENLPQSQLQTKSLICNEILLNSKNLCYLSCDKFGSNVVEKCLKTANKEQINELVIMMTSYPHQMELNAIANDRFGNYVIKTFVNKLDQQQQKDKVLRFTSNNNQNNNRRQSRQRYY